MAELERLGLVARRVSPGDRRARIVALTDRGRAVIVRAREARRAYEDRLRSVLGAARLSSMREALAMVLDDAGISGHIADRSIPWEE